MLTPFAMKVLGIPQRETRIGFHNPQTRNLEWEGGSLYLPDSGMIHATWDRDLVYARFTSDCFDPETGEWYPDVLTELIQMLQTMVDPRARAYTTPDLGNGGRVL